MKQQVNALSRKFAKFEQVEQPKLREIKFLKKGLWWYTMRLDEISKELDSEGQSANQRVREMCREIDNQIEGLKQLLGQQDRPALARAAKEDIAE